MGMIRNGRGNAAFFAGPGITENRTPIDDALACFGMAVRRAGKAGLGVGVGEVRDFTGKVTEMEGAQITQGGGLMVYSAIGKMGGAIRLHERLDPRIGEVELIYMDRRQLGDGRRHSALVGTQQQQVPWIPYFGGSIIRSDYYIVGGITELNQTITSGGFEFGLDLIGGRARAMVINVAADLRIVNTRTLVVERAVTLQKQVVGLEVGTDIFRFFGRRLVDVNAGIKTLEPVQLAVRAVLELATLELLDSVTGVDHRPCLPDVLRDDPAPSGSDPGGEERATSAVQSEPYSVGQARQEAISVPQPAAGQPASASGGAPANQPVAAAPAAGGSVEPRLAPVATPRPRPPIPEQAGGPRPRPPIPPRAEAPQPAPAAAASTRPQAAQGEAPRPPAVVLAALSSEAAAQQAWVQLRGRHAELLGPHRATVRNVQVQGRQLWVVVVALPPGGSPTGLCDALRARGAECEVAPPQLAGRAPQASAGG